MAPHVENKHTNMLLNPRRKKMSHQSIETNKSFGVTQSSFLITCETPHCNDSCHNHFQTLITHCNCNRY